ncbi:MAG TPA: serine hydrolase domain-containing protein [Blastocatellia bacterium]
MHRRTSPPALAAAARLAVIAASLSIACAIPARSQTKEIDFSALDKVVAEELSQRKIPGAAVAIVIGDRVVYAKGYGAASVETGAPVTPDTLFRMGSTTKMFTAAALVTLAHEGRLNLEAPVGNYVKGLHPSLARLSASQLLSHSAGLRDFASPVNSHDDAALAQNIRSWKEDVFFTEPGKIFSYSSPGYWFAGYVAEALHGKPYADALEELLFKPLGMNRTTLRPLVAATYPMAQGHKLESGKPAVIRPIYNNVAMWPGGSIFSSVNDLARFVVALLNDGKLEGKQALAPLVVEKLPARLVALPGGDAHYGYGLMSYRERGAQVVTHGGASAGYGSTIQLAPERRFAVITLTNRSGETLPHTRDKAMELALPRTPPDPEVTPAQQPLSEAEMNNYVGTYSHAPRTWEAFVKGGKLYLKHEGAEHPLTKVGPHAFSYGAGQLVFVPNASGKAEHLFMGLYAARKAGGVSHARPAVSAEQVARLKERLRRKLNEFHAAEKFPGATAGFALADGTSFGLAVGLSNVEAGTPMKPTDLMLQGSVGKTYVAAVALQLVQERRLRQDDKIEKYFAGEKWFARLPNAREITARMLMNHTSGLVRYEFKEQFTKDLTANPDKRWRPEELVAYILDAAPPFAAGQGWEYSDTNYIVLGMIIERVTKSSYYEQARRRALKPLKLTRTLPSDSRVIPGLIQGYAGANNPFGGTDAMIVNGKFAINPQFEWCGGGMASTTEDLARWAKALYEGRMFDQSLLREMLDGVPAKLGPEAKYGLGVIIRPTPMGVSYGHSGFFPGYITEMMYFPERKFAIAVQINTSAPRRGGKPLSQFVSDLAAIIAGAAD